jgi:F-type H+-transporting ATPase subunit delta
MPRRLPASPRRYAQALFQLALSHRTVERWADDLQKAAGALGDPALLAYLSDPGVKLQDRLQTLRERLPPLDPLVHNLLALLVGRRALGLVPAVRAEYQHLLDTYQKVHSVEVASALPLTEVQQEEIVRRLSAAWGRTVRLSTRVDPSIVGGVIIRVEDRVLDGSLRGRLESLRRTLAETPR